MGTYLVVILPLRLVLSAHLSNQLLDFGPPQGILSHHRAGVTGSIDLLRWVEINYLVGAVCTPSRRGLAIEP